MRWPRTAQVSPSECEARAPASLGEEDAEPKRWRLKRSLGNGTHFLETGSRAKGAHAADALAMVKKWSLHPLSVFHGEVEAGCSPAGLHSGAEAAVMIARACRELDRSCFFLMIFFLTFKDKAKNIYSTFFYSWIMKERTQLGSLWKCIFSWRKILQKSSLILFL